MEHEASYYHCEDSGQVRCSLCPHSCLISEGKNGLCRVRGNRAGKLLALTYGKIVSAAVDPIEKKPLYHFYPGVDTLSLGSIGCNLHCLHCQNWQISQCHGGEERPLRTLLPEDVLEQCRLASSDILVFTYNEPSLWVEYILDCASQVAASGIKLVMVTSAMIDSQPLEDLLKVIHAYRVDLKGFTGEFYKNLTGFDVRDQVLENIKSAYRAGVHLELVTNLIPGWNDDHRQLQEMTSWICEELGPEVPWHATRYYPCHRLQAPMTPVESLERAQTIGRSNGLKHIYLGNVPGSAGQDTHCAGCGALLIARNGFGVRRNRLQQGACPDCGRKLMMFRDESNGS